MKPVSRLALATLSILTALGAQAAGTVQVNFVEPDKFADARDAYMSREQHLKTLEQHLKAAAAPYLADGQTLKIDVLDVDLAGEVRFGARPHDVRVMRGRADWPRIEMRYSLEAAGQAARSGQARVQDLAYLQRLPSYHQNEALAYERRMLDEWFKAEFASR
jgi:Protein of unknown function (DUF3016)